jgi:glycosyltransferase involved in cell wall biosynthesis
MNATVEPGNAILVVIPVFNRSKMIIEALDSVASQTLRPSEIVVVDDGSTDATAATVDAWIGAHREFNVSLIRSPNRGASVARNLGFAGRHPRAEFVVFLDSDDFWPDDFLERASRCLRKNGDSTLAVADRIFVEVDGVKTNVVSSRPFEIDPFLQLIRVGAGYGSAALIRASSFEASGGYPEDVPTGHDIVLFEKLITAGKCLHIEGAPVTIRVWVQKFSTDQEPHLHLRYPDRYIRWAETYLSVCQSRSGRPGLNARRELRYHAAIAYRFLLALALDIAQLRPKQVLRILKDIGQLGALSSRTFVKTLTSKDRTVSPNETPPTRF